MEYARSLFSALLQAESEEDALSRLADATQLAASAEGKSSWTKYPRKRIAVKMELVDSRFHGPAIGSERSRVASHLAPPVSWEGERATGCEPFLSLVGQVPPLALKQIDQKSLGLSLTNLEPRENMTGVRPADRSRDCQ